MVGSGRRPRLPHALEKGRSVLSPSLSVGAQSKTSLKSTIWTSVVSATPLVGVSSRQPVGQRVAGKPRRDFALDDEQSHHSGSFTLVYVVTRRISRVQDVKKADAAYRRVRGGSGPRSLPAYTFRTNCRKKASLFAETTRRVALMSIQAAVLERRTFPLSTAGFSSSPHPVGPHPSPSGRMTQLLGGT